MEPAEDLEERMNYRAAIERDGDVELVRPGPRARTRTYFRSRSAALRALERESRRSPVNIRGFLWPISAGDLTVLDLKAGLLPPYVETLAL